MTRTIYYTATTLDGFIATPDHSLEWLVHRDNDPDGPMGYHPFIADIGALAMGASTYRWVLGQPDAWPYEIPAWIFTHGTFPARADADIRITREPIPVVHAEMAAAAGDRNIWITGGGDLAGQFADHGLLDEVCVSIAPVTLGTGRPLLPRHLELRQTEITTNGDFACVRYEVVKA